MRMLLDARAEPNAKNKVRGCTGGRGDVSNIYMYMDTYIYVYHIYIYGIFMYMEICVCAAADAPVLRRRRTSHSCT